jgi:hypothetical protein
LIASPWSATRTGCARRCARSPTCRRARRRASRSPIWQMRRPGWPQIPTEAGRMSPGWSAVGDGDGSSGTSGPAADEQPEWAAGSWRPHRCRQLRRIPGCAARIRASPAGGRRPPTRETAASSASAHQGPGSARKRGGDSPPLASRPSCWTPAALSGRLSPLDPNVFPSIEWMRPVGGRHSSCMGSGSEPATDDGRGGGANATSGVSRPPRLRRPWPAPDPAGASCGTRKTSQERRREAARLKRSEELLAWRPR